MNKNNLEEKAQEWQGAAEEAAQDLRAKAKETAATMQDKAKEWQRKTAQTVRQASQTADAYVHDSPWTVIASVGVACLVVGFLLGRSRD